MYVRKVPDPIIQEYIHGEGYTIDMFVDKDQSAQKET